MPVTGVGAISRWHTVGLGVITAMLVFGVTLSLLMAFAGPGSSSARGVRPPMAARSSAPPATSPEPAPRSAVARSAAAPAPTATHGELVIKAQPDSALVTVNGRSMGNAPFEGVLEVGVHEVTVEADGHRPWKSTVEIVRGERQTLNVVLTTEGSVPSVVAGRRRPRRVSRRSDPIAPSSTTQPPADSNPVPAARRLDREGGGFKKLNRSEPGFKKLGEGEPKIEKLH